VATTGGEVIAGTKTEIFIKATTTITAPGAPIILPKSAPNEVDYEAELAIVIGRQAHRVAEADALHYIFGYTCANDVSARDCQIRHDVQWARGKSFDTFCPIGPHIVTADEVDGDHLPVRSVLNGNVMQDSNTSDMIFSCRHLVSYLSHQFTLLPGTVPPCQMAVELQFVSVAPMLAAKVLVQTAAFVSAAANSNAAANMIP